MPNRREFLKKMAGASAGAFVLGGGLSRVAYGAPQAAKRREIMLGGKRVKVVDMHTHAFVPEVTDMVKGTNLEMPAAAIQGQLRGRDQVLGPDRVQQMDMLGVDVHAASINPFWYGSMDQDLVRRLIDLQNEKLAGMVAKNPNRFVAYATVALQFPELAAAQLEEGMKRWGLKGAAIGGNVNGEELSAAKFDPFWAKAQELQAAIFMHPQDSIVATGIGKRTGNGDMANIGNPLETSLFIGHLIFDGTLDHFPNLRIICAHGGGFLPSYPYRMDFACLRNPSSCKEPGKKPSDYLKKLYVDSLVFTPEAVAHLVAVMGPSQVVIGTDGPIPWIVGSPVDPILEAPGLSDADKVALLGGNACKLLKIPT
jgi:predicted TIM-barrel fold metal-dependent hydrolase